MFSTFPSTPGRGRSRFSKALPTAPGEAFLSPESSPALISKYMHSPLPPLPITTEKKKMAAIQRRPVGGGVGGISGGIGLGLGMGPGTGVGVGGGGGTGHGVPKAPSVKSVSSIYSDSPGLSRSISDTSTKESLSGVDSDIGPTPPLPPKDRQRQQALPPPETPNKLLDKPLPNFNPSPPRTELWKRRSASSNKSIQFADLKLQKSNGSTASPPRRPENLIDRPLPRSIASRKPIPSREAPPQPDFMGNKISKLRKRVSKENLEPLADTGKNENTNRGRQTTRLPTPEYLKADKRPEPSSKVLSPRSPFTPPEDKAPALPPKSESRVTENVRPEVERSNSESTTIRPDVFSSSSQPNSRDTSNDTVAVTSEAPTLVAPPPSEKPFAARLLSPQLSADKTSPLALPSPTHRIRFPSIKSPAPSGTIFPGPELNIVHFDCYQEHKFMRSTRNVQCPTGCMICQKKDTETRWRCNWCCLSACASCMQVLTATPGKDLRVCLERVRK